MYKAFIKVNVQAGLNLYSSVLKLAFRMTWHTFSYYIKLLTDYTLFMQAIMIAKFVLQEHKAIIESALSRVDLRTAYIH